MTFLTIILITLIIILSSLIVLLLKRRTDIIEKKEFTQKEIQEWVKCLTTNEDKDDAIEKMLEKEYTNTANKIASVTSKKTKRRNSKETITFTSLRVELNDSNN